MVNKVKIYNYFLQIPTYVTFLFYLKSCENFMFLVPLSLMQLFEKFFTYKHDMKV